MKTNGLAHYNDDVFSTFHFIKPCILDINERKVFIKIVKEMYSLEMMNNAGFDKL